jgi:hypothetical protein
MAADATNDDGHADGTRQPTDPATGEKPEAPPEPAEESRDADVVVSPKILQEVADALELADYVVKHGEKRNDARLPATVLRTIKVTAGEVGLIVGSTTSPDRISFGDKTAAVIKASDWTKFELAYYTLAEFTAPVTIDTLRDTRETGKGVSAAQEFTRWLWVVTGFFIACVLVGGIITAGAETGTRTNWRETFRALNDYVPILVPWTYGGLGACAYLLRTAHDMIAKRCFDVRRQPEYYNRILLGAVSGGSIVLLVSPSGDDDVVKISAAALGFLAGYSNDLLFNAVERVTTALLPKIGLDTVQKERLIPKQIELPSGGLTLRELMVRMEQATKPEDKELYRSLVEKLRDRL